MVCLDSAVENMVPALALNTDRVLEDKWNGWARPIATAAAFRDFLARWRANDPNGTWGDVAESEAALQYEDAEGSDPEYFPCVGTAATGEALFDFSGWVWAQI